MQSIELQKTRELQLIQLTTFGANKTMPIVNVSASTKTTWDVSLLTADVTRQKNVIS